MTYEEKAALAGEYVLGTLTAEERDEVERLLPADAELADEVAFWQRRLFGLTATIGLVEPPASIWTGIEQKLGPVAASSPQPIPVEPAAAAPRGDNVIDLKRRLGIWRTATAIITGLAAVLAVTLFLGPQIGLGSGDRFVAAIDQEGQPPAILVNVDTGSGLITARSINASAPAEHSYELWYIGDGQDPQSLGVIDSAGAIIAVGTDELTDFNPNGALFAITEEPVGGSPTGAPTGPIVLSGPLVHT